MKFCIASRLAEFMRKMAKIRARIERLANNVLTPHRRFFYYIAEERAFRVENGRRPIVKGLLFASR